MKNLKTLNSHQRRPLWVFVFCFCFDSTSMFELLITGAQSFLVCEPFYALFVLVHAVEATINSKNNPNKYFPCSLHFNLHKLFDRSEGNCWNTKKLQLKDLDCKILRMFADLIDENNFHRKFAFSKWSLWKLFMLLKKACKIFNFEEFRMHLSLKT